MSRGIATAWAVVFIGLCCYALAWYVFAYMAQEVIAGFEGAYSFPSGADVTVTILKFIVAWHPIFAIAGWLLYGIFRSTKTEYRGYEL